MGGLNPIGTLQPPRKMFWRDPLRLIFIVAFTLGFIGSVLGERYPIASVLGWIGMPVGFAAGIAILLRKRSGRPL